LRARPRAWTATVWVISGVASIAALTGVLLGLALLVAHRGLTPSGRWHRWHHALGLTCAVFVLTWIVSGWLSLDSGLLFSTRTLAAAEASVLAPAPDWASLSTAEAKWTPQAREVEWFALGGELYRRDRTGLDAQRLLAGPSGSEASPQRAYLTLAEIEAVARRLPYTCEAAAIDAGSDAYPSASTLPGAPAYRIACGGLWFHVDGASGVILDRLDASRRAHRWLYGALHTLDIPWLTARPALRSALVVGLCACGLVFSLTGCVIAWRRMRLWVGKAGVAR
jgi:hypothetical protein